MTTDELWSLHNELTDVITRRLESKKEAIDRQLTELGRRFGGSPGDLPKARPYPPVRPKFFNPQKNTETWSGRGRQPQWVVELLARGESLEDFRVQ